MWNLVKNEDKVDAFVLFNKDISEYNVELISKGYNGLYHPNGKHNWDTLAENIIICLTCKKCIRLTKKIK